MQNSLRIARIGGIDIGVHYSWLLVFLLVAWTLAVGLFPQQYPGLSGSTYWAMGAASSLLLFVSVLIHELAHSFMAKARGLTVTSIVLFIFGGVSNIAQEAKSAGEEFLVAVVGPLSSLVLAGVFWALNRTPLASTAVGDGILSYLAYINLSLAVFNLIPGFPLDGGRVLRAALWGVTNNLRRATTIAAGVGRGVGLLFVLGGIFMAINGAFIGGLWLTFIGWFLGNAAESSNQQMEITARLQGVPVGTVMNSRPVVVESGTRLSELVSSYVLRQGVRSIPVVDGSTLLGMITLNEVRSVPQDEWGTTPVRFVMTKLADLHTTTPDTPLASALNAMGEHDVNQLPVVQGDHLVGIISRGDVIRFLQVRQELGIEGRRAA